MRFSIILLESNPDDPSSERSNATALRHVLVGLRMGELIARWDAIDIRGLSLAREALRIEFVLKYNGYTVTSTGRLLLASGFAPREECNCLRTLPKLQYQQLHCAAREDQDGGLQSPISRLTKASRPLLLLCLFLTSSYSYRLIHTLFQLPCL